MRETRILVISILIGLIVVLGLQCTAVAMAAKTNTTSPANNTTIPVASNPPKPTAIPTGSINGTVYDSANNLVPDADVYLKDASGTVMGLTITDRNGSYVYTELEPGNYTIIVQTEGYMWIAKTFVNTGNSTRANVFMPDYVHWPAVTPWPTPVPRANDTTLSASPKSGAVKVTAAPTVVPASGNDTTDSTSTTNATKPSANLTSNGTASNNTHVSAMSNSTSGDVNESESGDIFSGIIGFFKSIFGM